LNQIVWGLAYQWVSVSGGDNGITGLVRPHIGPFDVSANTGYYYVCLAFFVISLGLMLTIVRSPFGLVLKGVRETPRRMRALGYNVWLYRYLALMISGGFAGVAGVLFAWYNQFVGPVALSLDQSTQILIMVILGGIGTLYGQLFGALVVVFLSNELSAVTQRWETVLGIIYFVVVMYAPGGLVVLVPRLIGRLRGGKTNVTPPEPLAG
jgi:branched-chain amino acid transport system permease protein